MLTIYGIPNCDTMKKAFDWFKARGVAYAFHDYKQSGISADKLKAWCDQVGWEKLLNKASTTFKALPDMEKANLDEHAAIRLMVSQPSMIKRPVIEIGNQVLTGFRPDTVAALEKVL